MSKSTGGDGKSVPPRKPSKPDKTNPRDTTQTQKGNRRPYGGAGRR